MQKGKIIEYDELQGILAEHSTWLNTWLTPGAEGKQAIFSHRLFKGSSISDVDMCRAMFYDCEFNKTDFKYVNLAESVFINCTFRDATLFEVDFTGALFRETFFHTSILHRCRFFDTIFRYSNFDNCKYQNTSFRGCHFTTLPFVLPYDDRDVIFSEVPSVCPSHGEFIGWKRCSNDVLVKLLIPKNAKRSSSTGRKCRCSEAVVLDLYGIVNDYDITPLPADIVARSIFDPSFTYKVGEIVKINDFDEDRWDECSTGIHFFIDRNEAIRYGR